MHKVNKFREQLNSTLNQAKTSFHVPGHKYGNAQKNCGYAGAMCLQWDTTEIPGTDNLHDAAGIIKEAQERASVIYGSRESYFLINGTTAGILAMILAAIEPGEKLLMGRDCHQSAFHGAWLAQADICWMMPDFDNSTYMNIGYTKERVEEALRKTPDIKAVLITYPTYFGLCSDIVGIGAVCRSHGVMLLVDEAHGAHFPLSSSLPPTALAAGADICVQSTHKTLPAMTQASLLHVGSGRIDRDKLRWMLRMVQSSSPSYVLMDSLDQAVEMMGVCGPSQMAGLLDDLEALRVRLSVLPGLMESADTWRGKGGITDFDPTKILLNASQIGFSGAALSEALCERFGIQMELSTPGHVLGIATIGNDKADLAALGDALLCIGDNTEKRQLQKMPDWNYRVPKRHKGWREAYSMRKTEIALEQSLGMTAGEMIVPYPPGIPLLVPGEKIESDVIDYLRQCREMGISVIGTGNGEDLRIKVVAE